MNTVDKLTLELFTSKSTYRKYLAKNDPETFQKQEIQQEKLQEYKSEILERIEDMLEHPPSGELGELSERFFSCLLQEIESSKRREMEERETSKPLFYEDGSEGIEDLEEEDELFPATKMEEPHEKKSFWSKDRVIKREIYSEDIAHYPTNSEIRKRYIGKKMINS
jgi:hypothetical protein